MNIETVKEFLEKLPSTEKSVQHLWGGIEVIGLENQSVDTIFMSDKILTNEERENINELYEVYKEKGLTDRNYIPKVHAVDKNG